MFGSQNGSLAVTGGRDIAPLINELLALPFTLRIATRDFHPRDHLSFASNHEPPNNKPFESFVTIANPYNSAETETSRLWPDHCIQGTPGCELVPELDSSRIDHIIEKGQDSRVEMYSAFAAPFSNPLVASSGLAEILKKKQITHVYTVGLALDYCVKATAIDAAKNGFKAFVVKDASRAVDSSQATLEALEKELDALNVQMTTSEGKEIDMVKMLTSDG